MNLSDEHYINRVLTLGLNTRSSDWNDHSVMALTGGQRMKNLIAVACLVAFATGCTPTGPVFSIQDRAGLGAFLAFEIVANDAAPAPKPDGGSPAGDWCDECTVNGKPIYPSHPGKVGDGTVFNTCPVCDGTMKAPGMQQSHAETVRKAGENSPLVEEEVEEEELTFNDAVKDITQLGGTSWTIEEKSSRNASDADIREHLVSVHGIDPDSANKMDREELLSLHNLLHNTETRSSAPSSSCPSGTCPVNASGGSSCPTCPSGSSRSSSSRSRGLFGRRR
jgi:hypothetical protein